VGSLSINQVSQGGATPWVSTNNWTIRSNIFQNCGFMALSQIEEYETGQTSSGLVVDNNLFTLTSEGWLKLQGGSGATLTHNTARNIGGGAIGDNWYIEILNLNPGSTVKDNIGNWISYGYNDQSGTGWVAASTINHNYLIDNASMGCSNITPFLPAGDNCVASSAAMMFVNAASADAGGDYHGYKLTASSPGYRAATDGTDVGVNFTTLDAALQIGGGGAASSTIKGLVLGGPAVIH
jgi:hypothetical protein